MLLFDYIKHQLHSRAELNDLAEQIKAGINNTGCCILDDYELQSVWDKQQVSTDQKRLALEHFAKHYGFYMHLTPNVKVAVFKDKEHPTKPYKASEHSKSS